MLTEDLDTLEAGVGYQYRVPREELRGQQRLVLLRQCRDRARRDSHSARYQRFHAGRGACELNTWLFWSRPKIPGVMR